MVETSLLAQEFIQQETEMKSSPISQKKYIKWLVIGLPVIGVCTSAFFPLLPVVRQGMILIVLLWFQITLLLGIFN